MNPSGCMDSFSGVRIDMKELYVGFLDLLLNCHFENIWGSSKNFTTIQFAKKKEWVVLVVRFVTIDCRQSVEKRCFLLNM